MVRWETHPTRKPMKLRKLHIEDYKMFKDFDISFVDDNDVALPIIVLAGVNGSGKTTLLECISKENIFEHERSILVVPDDTDEEVFVSLHLSDYDYLIKEGATSEVLRKHCEEKSKKQEYDEYTGLSIPEYQYLENIIYLSTETDLAKFKKLLPNYIRDMIYNEGKKPFDTYVEIEQFIQAVFKDFNMQVDFDKRDGEGNLFFKNKQGVRFSIDDLSTGEKTLLTKVLYLFFKDCKDKVILIDEPELSLHPSWQNRVLKIYEDFAEQNSCQIIIATHSPHIIGSAKSECLRLLKKEDNKIVAIENIDRSYGLEFDKVLTDIMRVENLRTPEVAKDIKRLWELLEDENYESEEYIELYDKLEDLLGELDKDMVLSRLEIARIKSRNAKSK